MVVEVQSKVKKAGKEEKSLFEGWPAEIGVEGIKSFEGHVTETYLDQLRWPAAYNVYDEMRRRDPTLRSIIHVTKLLAKTATWKVGTATDKPGDREAGAFLSSCLMDMSHTVSDFIDDVLTALPFGWSSFEIVYQRRDGAGLMHNGSQFNDGRVGWRKLAYRRQSSFSRWMTDSHNDFHGWYQSAPPDYAERPMPVKVGGIQKLLHFTMERDGGNPEGMALFESAYEPWHYVSNLQIIGGIGWQRSFVGLPVFEFENRPQGNDLTQVQSIGQGLQVGAKQYVSVPPKVKFRLETVANNGAASLLDYIKYFRTMMTQMVLADFLMLGTQGSGSWSLGSDKSMLFLMAVDAFLDRIAEIWNRHGVQPLFGITPANTFAGMTAVPRLVHSKIQKIALGPLGAFIQQIAPYIPLYNDDAVWLREQAGMPQPAADSPPLSGTGGGVNVGTTPGGGGGLWQYPDTRAPVGAALEHNDGEGIELKQPPREEDPTGEIKTEAETMSESVMLNYFSDLRKRILKSVKLSGIQPPPEPEVI